MTMKVTIEPTDRFVGEGETLAREWAGTIAGEPVTFLVRRVVIRDDAEPAVRAALDDALRYLGPEGAVQGVTIAARGEAS